MVLRSPDAPPDEREAALARLPLVHPDDAPLHEREAALERMIDDEREAREKIADLWFGDKHDPRARGRRRPPRESLRLAREAVARIADRTAGAAAVCARVRRPRLGRAGLMRRPPKEDDDEEEDGEEEEEEDDDDESEREEEDEEHTGRQRDDEPAPTPPCPPQWIARDCAWRDQLARDAAARAELTRQADSLRARADQAYKAGDQPAAERLFRAVPQEVAENSVTAAARVVGGHHDLYPPACEVSERFVPFLRRSSPSQHSLN